ncbi:MAG: hypothetical protein JNM66_21360 [Bryobacterales bacterium]|nr:hypothetical protein [Bryobacterales bacterium]
MRSLLGLLLLAADPATLLRTTLPVSARGPAGALVIVGGTLDEKTCEALRNATAIAKNFGVSGRVFGTKCNTAFLYGGDAGFGVRAGRVVALIADEKGVIRYERTLPVSVAGMSTLGSDLVAWEQGRGSFAGHCGHCHGDDGAGTFFQGIKSMAGITTRMSDQKILEGGESFGAVSISTWTKAEVDSFLLFVRGL